MKRLLYLLRKFLTLGAAANTTSLPSYAGALPAGMVADPAPLYGLLGFLNNMQFLDWDLLAIANGSATTLTLTAQQFLLNAVLDISGSPGSGLTVTLPTAASILANLPNTVPKNGFNFPILIMNDSTGQTITVAAGAGVTLSATTATIANNTSRMFMVNVNINAGTVTVVGIGGGLSL